MKSVLFVCAENSCRSQMAEGFARAVSDGNWKAWSAGSRPFGKVNETAIALMKERGIDLSAQRSKGLSELPPIVWDYAVSMGCGDRCPSVPAWTRLEWDIPDPKKMTLDQFRLVRDKIEKLVLALLREE